LLRPCATRPLASGEGFGWRLGGCRELGKIKRCHGATEGTLWRATRP